ncbi:MAG TPA: DUF429 domain-containing protein [Planctomycetaceae bacterium]|nr:DUF429 domain-containing protein [Planctomycetaceae bacterium]
MPIRLPHFDHVVGVDFSGARLSGLNAWISKTEIQSDRQRLKLVELSPLGKLAASDDRDDVNAYLVQQVNESRASLWGFDFPFGLPVELKLGTWAKQLESIGRFEGDAKSYGRFLVERTRQISDLMHIRRVTDRETQTPFDCYHYRIIYQTFHGMRDILRHVHASTETAVLPFQFEKLSDSASPVKRVVVEACPSSTLKRLALPHRMYKQVGGKSPTPEKIAVRKTILATVEKIVDITPSQRKVMLSNPGGDALDSLLAAVGVFQVTMLDDHQAIAKHPRYRREGRVYG